MLPVIAAVGVGVCLLVRARPSTLVRVVEDAAIKAPKNVARRAKRIKHDVTIEYKARQIDKLQRAVAVEAATLRAMSDEQRAALAADEAAIFRRAEELRAQRELAKPKVAKRAERSATL